MTTEQQGAAVEHPELPTPSGLKCWATEHDDGPKFWPTREEALSYCDEGESPVLMTPSGGAVQGEPVAWATSEQLALPPESEEWANVCRRKFGVWEIPLFTAPQPASLDVDALANEIRRVNGSNTMGAGALAEAIVAFITKENGNG